MNFDSNVNRDGKKEEKVDLRQLFASDVSKRAEFLFSFFLTCIILNPDSLHGGFFEVGG